MKRVSGNDYQPERNVRPYQALPSHASLRPGSTRFSQALFNCTVNPCVDERAQFYLTIKKAVHNIRINSSDLQKLSSLCAQVLMIFDRDEDKLKELASWIREYVNNEVYLFSPLVQEVLTNVDLYESLLLRIQGSITHVISEVSTYLAVESVMTSDADRLFAVIVKNVLSALSLNNHPIAAENIKEIVKSLVDDFIKNRSHDSQLFDDKKMRSMAKRILRKWLLNPPKIDIFKRIYCLERKLEIKINPLEINEVLDTLLFQMDPLSIGKLNFVSKKFNSAVESFFQKGWFDVSSKKTARIKDIYKYINYAKEKFELTRIKKIYIKEDSSDLAPLYKFQNLEYLSLNNCPNLIKFSHFKFLKVLDLSFCSDLGGGNYFLNGYYKLSDCASLEKLKLHKCKYSEDSLKDFLSNDKFLEKKFTLILHNGDKYKGCFKKGKYHGDGEIKSLDGTRYKGGFNEGKFHGQGRYSYPNRDIYEGGFQNGLFEGKGVSTFANGDVYKGDYAADVSHGKGVYIYINGDSYEGDFENGLRHGKGVFKHANGDIYEGDYENDLCHGQGRFTCLNGNILEGEFKNGIFVNKAL